MPAPLIALLSVLAGSIGIPVPSAAALVYVGSLMNGLALGIEDVVAAMAGALVGDVVWYFVGRRLGTRALGLLCRLSLSRDTCARHMADFFFRHGVHALLFTRFVPGLAILSAPMAGASGVSFGRFLAYAVAGDVLWIGTCLFIGFYLVDQIGMLMGGARRLGVDVGGVALAVVVAYVAFRLFRRWQLLRRLRMVRISPEELSGLMAAGAPVVVDVRSAMQRADDPFRIPGSLLMEFGEIGSASGLPRDEPVIIYCACPNEISAALAVNRLRKRGLGNVRPLRGGIDGWRDAGYAVEPLEAGEP